MIMKFDTLDINIFMNKIANKDNRNINKAKNSKCVFIFDFLLLF